MAQLQYLQSYKTEKFDTPSGDLEDGQYYIDVDGNYYIKEAGQGLRKEDSSYNVTGLTQKTSVGSKYVNEFMNTDQTVLKEEITQNDYEALALPDAIAPIKEM